MNSFCWPESTSIFYELEVNMTQIISKIELKWIVPTV